MSDRDMLFIVGIWLVFAVAVIVLLAKFQLDDIAIEVRQQDRAIERAQEQAS